MRRAAQTRRAARTRHAALTPEVLDEAVAHGWRESDAIAGTLGLEDLCEIRVGEVLKDPRRAVAEAALEAAVRRRRVDKGVHLGDVPREDDAAVGVLAGKAWPA